MSSLERVCKLEDCSSPVGRSGAKGFCSIHYARFKRWGEPDKLTMRMGEARKKHPLYCRYKSMKARCYNANNKSYSHYGGRGIKVCDQWQGIDGFTHFVEDMGTPHTNASLDRIDVNGNYSPENCRWATSEVQSLNRTKQKNNTTGVVGVYFRKDTGKWRSMIGVGGTLIKLGTFATKRDAVSARKMAEQIYHSPILQKANHAS